MGPALLPQTHESVCYMGHAHNEKSFHCQKDEIMAFPRMKTYLESVLLSEIFLIQRVNSHHVFFSHVLIQDFNLHVCVCMEFYWS